jgi:hypothetical protein
VKLLKIWCIQIVKKEPGTAGAFVFSFLDEAEFMWFHKAMKCRKPFMQFSKSINFVMCPKIVFQGSRPTKKLKISTLFCRIRLSYNAWEKCTAISQQKLQHNVSCCELYTMQPADKRHSICTSTK